MRKYFILVLFTLINSLAYSQETLLETLPVQNGIVTYSGVVNVDSLDKNALYLKAKKWFVTTYKSAKDVIQFEDKEIVYVLQAGFKTTSGPVLEKPGDLAGLLTNLEEGDVLFIDEIHRLSPVVEEFLYSAMEDYKIDIMIDSGPNARSIQIEVAPFTLIGATTRSGLLTAPLRARFGINARLQYYDKALMKTIIGRSADILKSLIDEEAAFEIARRSRGTPRIGNALLRRTRDFAQIKGDGTITMEIAQFALDALNVDEEGLDEMDTRILKTMIDKFKGGPVGLNTIATAIGEDAGTIEEVYEPYLIQEGFMSRTPRGREVTEKAYRHLGLGPSYKNKLF